MSGPPLYLESGSLSTGIRTPVGQLSELPRFAESYEGNEVLAQLRVSTRPDGPFFALDEALEVRPEVRDALLALSPEPRLDPWRKYRWVGVLAPAMWGLYVERHGTGVFKAAEDIEHRIAAAKKELPELDAPAQKEIQLKIAKLEKRTSLNKGYVGFEALVGVLALVVLLLGARRLRALPIAVGLAGGAYWIATAGGADRCFSHGAAADWVRALLGLGAAVALFFMVPAETEITRSLRERLGLKGSPHGAPSSGENRRKDLAATLGAAAAGLILPVILWALAVARISDQIRVTVFVGLGLAALLGFLSWRPETLRIAPNFRAIGLAAFLGLGVIVAADVGWQSGFTTYVESQRCFAPAAAERAEQIQRTSQKETTAARKATQTDWLALLIAVFAAPLAEEMLYRGALQRVARRALGSRWAVLGSAVIFGVAHFGALRTAWWLEIGLGLAFASVFEMAGGATIAILATAAVHLAWNGWLTWLPV